MDDSYEAPQSTLTDYYNATAHYAAQATPSSLPQSLTPIHIKHEPGLSDTRDSIGHHATSSLDGDPPRSSPLANASVPIPMVSAASGGIPPPQPVVDSPPNGTTPYAGHPDPVSVRMVPSPRSLTPTAPALLQHPPPSTSPKSSKKKKKKIKQEPIQE